MVSYKCVGAFDLQLTAIVPFEYQLIKMLTQLSMAKHGILVTISRSENENQI